MPTLIDMVTVKVPKTQDVDRIREIFSGYGEAQGKQLEAATVSMLKQHEGDAKVSKAEIEFYRVQKVEDHFHRDSSGSIRREPTSERTDLTVAASKDVNAGIQHLHFAAESIS